MAFIEFKNITKSFGDNEVLKNINLNIEKGEMVTLLGPSGCGKSTLLRCLAGLETVGAGRIYLDGTDITDVDPKNRDIGMVFQQYSLFPNMTVAQNAAFGLKLKKCPKAEIETRVKEMLELVGLADKADAYPSRLSGGQQQRAALARAMVTRPKVLLLDEPLSAIDALLRRNLQVEIRRLQQEMNITAIFVTHDQDEAMVISDMIHLMHDGKIEQSAAPAEMYTRPVSRFAASFIGHYNILSRQEVKNLTGEDETCEDVAFRPEMIQMSGEPLQKENCYRMKGVVRESLPHGNILRYGILCGEKQIDVDVLFSGDSNQLFKAGQEVWLSVEKRDAVLLGA